MDLKYKGIAWVGNIYQRFESMCHEVDTIVNQDTVRYVENQVHTVGESMKRFCSDVVQDLIPPIVDPVKYEAQAVSLKGNAAVGAYIKSMIGIKEDHGHMDPIKQSLVEPSSMVSGHHLVNQSTPTTPGESLEDAVSDSTPGKVDVSRNENSDLSTEENAIEEKSNIPAEENAMEEVSNIPEALELIAPREKELFNASVFSELIDSSNENACVSIAEVSPAISVHGEEFQPPLKVDIICYSPADNSDSVSDSSSAVAVSEMAFSVASSCGSIFTEPRTLHEDSFNDILTKVGSHCNPVNVASHDSDSSNVLVSSTSAPIVSSNREIAETGLTCSNSVLSLESTGCSSYSSYVIDDITDCGMETIDLSDKVKLEESCVIVDNNMLYEVSRRTRKLRSYKKKIQDAFTSKKRISKEYEQLAIWYGDLDIESSQDTVPGQLQSSTIVTLDPDQHHTHDSEWELL